MWCCVSVIVRCLRVGFVLFSCRVLRLVAFVVDCGVLCVVCVGCC